MATNAKDQAFPRLFGSTNNANGNYYNHEHEGGLTKLEHFAGLAMQGLLANPNVAGTGISNAQLSDYAVSVAQALIAELEKQQ